MFLCPWALTRKVMFLCLWAFKRSNAIFPQSLQPHWSNAPLLAPPFISTPSAFRLNRNTNVLVVGMCGEKGRIKNIYENGGPFLCGLSKKGEHLEYLWKPTQNGGILNVVYPNECFEVWSSLSDALKNKHSCLSETKHRLRESFWEENYSKISEDWV